MGKLDDARATLRLRLGKGARFDALQAPAETLAWARFGTAFFARKLGELSDTELDCPTRIAGWSRRHVVAHVGYQARHLARLAEAARAGTLIEELAEPESQNEDVAFGATLPAHALRYLFRHSEVHLNVEWRDMDAAAWNCSVTTLSGEMVPMRDTPWLRAREIWLRSIDLNNGASELDFPASVRDRLHAGSITT